MGGAFHSRVSLLGVLPTKRTYYTPKNFLEGKTLIFLCSTEKSGFFSILSGCRNVWSSTFQGSMSIRLKNESVPTLMGIDGAVISLHIFLSFVVIFYQKKMDSYVKM